MLKKIECYVRQSKLEDIKDRLIELEVDGMSVANIMGFGRLQTMTPDEKEDGKVRLVERLRIDIIVEEERVDMVISEIKKLAFTGSVGAGKIFVIPVEDAIRISTDEAGRSAIR